MTSDLGAIEEYIAHLVSSIDGTSLEGLTIVIDAANGASSATAKDAFETQGATVIADVADIYDLRGLREIDHIGHDNLPEGVRLNITPFDSRMREAPPHDTHSLDRRCRRPSWRCELSDTECELAPMSPRARYLP